MIFYRRWKSKIQDPFIYVLVFVLLIFTAYNFHLSKVALDKASRITLVKACTSDKQLEDRIVHTGNDINTKHRSPHQKHIKIIAVKKQYENNRHQTAVCLQVIPIK